MFVCLYAMFVCLCMCVSVCVYVFCECVYTRCHPRTLYNLQINCYTPLTWIKEKKEPSIYIEAGIFYSNIMKWISISLYIVNANKFSFRILLLKYNYLALILLTIIIFCRDPIFCEKAWKDIISNILNVLIREMKFIEKPQFLK